MCKGLERGNLVPDMELDTHLDYKLLQFGRVARSEEMNWWVMGGIRKSS